MKGPLSVILAVSIMSTTVLARAADGEEPTPAQVRAAAQAFDRGREAYKNEEYVDAAGQFEGADSNAPSAAALELAMRSRDKAGQLDRAATLAALALRRYPDDANIQKHAPDLVKRGKADLYELNAKCDNACQLTLNGKIVHGAPALEHTLYLPAGDHTLRAGFSDDRTVSKQLTAAVGEAGELSFEAPPAAEAEAAPAPEAARVEQESAVADTTLKPKGSGWSPVVFYAGVGLTAVAGGVTIWSGLDTQNNPGPDRVRDECAGQGESCPLYKEGLAKQLRTNVLIAVTGGLAVGTILVAAFATNWSGGDSEADQGKSKQTFAMKPWLSIGDGAAVGAEGRF